jgi:hypothetical protein
MEVVTRAGGTAVLALLAAPALAHEASRDRADLDAAAGRVIFQNVLLANPAAFASRSRLRSHGRRPARLHGPQPLQLRQPQARHRPKGENTTPLPGAPSLTVSRMRSARGPVRPSRVRGALCVSSWRRPTDANELSALDRLRGLRTRKAEIEAPSASSVPLSPAESKSTDRSHVRDSRSRNRLASRP